MKQESARPTRRTDSPEQARERGSDEVTEEAGLLSVLDELLDEIDSVLEDQSVLTTFRQRPGQ